MAVVGEGHFRLMWLAIDRLGRSHTSPMPWAAPPGFPPALFASAKCRYTALTELLAHAGIRLLRIPNVIAIPFVLFALAPGILLCRPKHSERASKPLADRVKTLNAIFSDDWEDRLKHEPEFASSIGDNRYNDRLSDFSVQAYNESFARGRGFLNSTGRGGYDWHVGSGAVE